MSKKIPFIQQWQYMINKQTRLYAFRFSSSIRKEIQFGGAIRNAIADRIGDLVLAHGIKKPLRSHHIDFVRALIV